MDKKDVIIALDFKDRQETMNFINKFNRDLFVKVGMELFYKEGTDIIKALQEKGHKIFLDLKLHDIPTTVYRAMKNIAKLDVSMVNVHALGGEEMMAQAIYGLNEGSDKKRPLCIAVTILTSLKQDIVNNELLINGKVDDIIKQYAYATKKAGLDGVVCSPLEANIIHQSIGNDFLTVTPGIRLENDFCHDQKRIATPIIAKELGTDYIVVGRSITQSIDPQNTYQTIKKQFLE